MVDVESFEKYAAGQWDWRFRHTRGFLLDHGRLACQNTSLLFVPGPRMAVQRNKSPRRFLEAVLNPRHRVVLLLLLLAAVAMPAHAYIGPGAGISFIGSLFSTLMVFLVAIGAVLFWPVRYLWRRLRRLSREAKQAPTE